MMQIRILVTGGTFDKEYDELSGKLFFKDTHVQEMLRRGRSRLDLTIETVMMVDSLDMDDAGRAVIVARCRDAAEPAIVVTHGTDTLEESAYLVARSLPPDKPVVFTGAMRPASDLGWDGPSNLLDATRVAASPESSGNGTLVCIGERIHSALEVGKTHTEARDAFESPGLGALGLAHGARAQAHPQAAGKGEAHGAGVDRRDPAAAGPSQQAPQLASVLAARRQRAQVLA